MKDGTGYIILQSGITLLMESLFVKDGCYSQHQKILSKEIITVLIIVSCVEKL
jgi:hypothetical protein